MSSVGGGKEMGVRDVGQGVRSQNLSLQVPACCPGSYSFLFLLLPCSLANLYMLFFFLLA